MPYPLNAAPVTHTAPSVESVPVGIYVDQFTELKQPQHIWKQMKFWGHQSGITDIKYGFPRGVGMEISQTYYGDAGGIAGRMPAFGQLWPRR